MAFIQLKKPRPPKRILPCERRRYWISTLRSETWNPNGPARRGTGRGNPALLKTTIEDLSMLFMYLPVMLFDAFLELHTPARHGDAQAQDDR